MDISYDPAKDRANRRKHGVSLALPAKIDWARALERRDDREDYGETRFKALAFVGDTLYSVVYVDRPQGGRIISLRKATRREYITYGERSW